jgi:surface antigen
VSDELTPDPLAELLENAAPLDDAMPLEHRGAAPSAPAPLVPATPQFSSRREVRAATGKPSRRKQQAAATPSARSPKPAGIPRAGKGPSASTPRSSKPSSSKPSSSKPSSSKLSRKDRALVRRLAVTPRTPVTLAKASGKPAKKQNPLMMVFILLVISGFVGGIALPAAALNATNPGEAQSIQPASVQGKQDFTADATIQAPKVSRDEIGATSEAELKAEQINAATLASYPGKRAPGDDYPWRSAGYGLSPLNYYYRQCVDFVAWRLNRDAGVTSAPWKWTWQTLTPNGGDASQWKAAWEAHGWKTSATPVVGSVAWFVGNHVAYVNAIKGSNVVIEEYNGTSSRAYAMRTIPIDTVGRFLYPPP